jgi:hypothetical protein
MISTEITAKIITADMPTRRRIFVACVILSIASRRSPLSDAGSDWSFAIFGESTKLRILSI